MAVIEWGLEHMESAERDAEHRLEVVSAKKKVAEDLGWVISPLVFLLTFMLFDSWLVAFLCVIPSHWFFVVHLYDAEYEQALDFYMRVTKTGPYSTLSSDENTN